MDKLSGGPAMRILLTGSNGFLGQHLTRFITRFHASHLVLYGISGRPNRNPYLNDAAFEQVDLENPEALASVVRAFAPTHIIHTAALSSVDTCEKDPGRCQRVNVDSTHLLARLAQKHDIYLLFLSTDFVFDGLNGPYHETDVVGPCNAYGDSKLAAEYAIQQAGCRYAILRTILVYGQHTDKYRAKNLILWTKSSLEQGQAIRVVHDQWRMPTWVDDLAAACYLAASKQAEGVFHISGSEMMSIAHIAETVADFWGLDKKLLEPVSAKDMDQDLNRPRQTGFVLTKAREQLGFVPTPFLTTLAEMEKQLQQENK